MNKAEAIKTIIRLAEQNCSDEIKKIGRNKIICHSWEELLIVYDHLFLHELREEKYLYIDFRYRIHGKHLYLRRLSRKKSKLLDMEIELQS